MQRCASSVMRPACMHACGAHAAGMRPTYVQSCPSATPYPDHVHVVGSYNEQGPSEAAAHQARAAPTRPRRARSNSGRARARTRMCRCATSRPPGAAPARGWRPRPRWPRRCRPRATATPRSPGRPTRCRVRGRRRARGAPQRGVPARPVALAALQALRIRCMHCTSLDPAVTLLAAGAGWRAFKACLQREWVLTERYSFLYYFRVAQARPRAPSSTRPQKRTAVARRAAACLGTAPFRCVHLRCRPSKRRHTYLPDMLAHVA
jgi:hypothetical protein